MVKKDPPSLKLRRTKKKFKPGKKQRFQRGQEEIGFVVVMAFVSIVVLVFAAILLSTLKKFFR